MQILQDNNLIDDNKLNSYQICAIVVACNPDLKLLHKMLTAIAEQVGGIVIVDNSTTVVTPDFQDLQCSVRLLSLGGNFGIARAHNVGIMYAEKQGYKSVILMDQDSIATPEMVKKLLVADNQLTKERRKIAAIGPQLIDPIRKKSIPFIIRKGKRIQRFSCNNTRGNLIFEVEHLISSGSLISINALQQIGKMEEGLFIDYVDIEWAFRARKAGYLSYATCASVLEHHLGDRLVTNPFFRNRFIPLYSPERYYYHFRNAFVLYKRRYVPFSWKIYHFSRHIIFKFFFFSLILPPRRKNCQMMLLGMLHAIRGINGGMLKKKLAENEKQ